MVYDPSVFGIKKAASGGKPLFYAKYDYFNFFYQYVFLLLNKYYDHFKSQAGLPNFVISASEWIEKTNAVGLVVKKGSGCFE